MPEDNLPEALAAAIEFEKKGKAFYLQTAGEVKDPLSKKLFQTLAEDEDRHARRIEEIYQTLSNHGPWPSNVLRRNRSLEQDIHDFFKKHRRKIKPSVDNITGYTFAMQMEKAGIQMYTLQLQKAQEHIVKAFFEALLQEEYAHLEALQNVHYYLSQAGDWNQEEESKHWNWMNL